MAGAVLLIHPLIHSLILLIHSCIYTHTHLDALLPLNADPHLPKSCSSNHQTKTTQVSAGARSLHPLFAPNLTRFSGVGLRSVLRVLLYDQRGALDARLLGSAVLPAAAVHGAGSAPLYLWLPLSAPRRGGRGGRLNQLKVRQWHNTCLRM